jgi:hypothetical protein
VAGSRWIACRPRFFLPVHVLSRLYRRLFLARLAAAFEAGALQFFGDLADLAEPCTFAHQIEALRQMNWVVYAKPPFGSPEQLLAYLGRYTTASPSPIAASWRSMTPASASAGATIASAARSG